MSKELEISGLPGLNRSYPNINKGISGYRSAVMSVASDGFVYADGNVTFQAYTNVF